MKQLASYLKEHPYFGGYVIGLIVVGFQVNYTNSLG